MTNKVIISERDQEGHVVELYERSSGHLEIYADGIQGVMIGEHIAKFNFFIDTMSLDERKRTREIACTIVIPVRQLQAIGDIFLDLSEKAIKATKSQA